MPHVIITGGAGFIGSHIVDRYIAEGWSVTILDDLGTGLRTNVNPAARLIVGDFADADALAEAFRSHVDLVNHHAAQIDVRKSVADPAHDANENIVKSVRLFRHAIDSGVRKLIFASSGGAIYGEPLTAPQQESHPFQPLSPYGIAKLSVEYYLDFFRKVHGVTATALRYGNVYGPRQRPDGEAGVVAIFAGRMLRGEEVTINGDGEQTRDYVFVADVARANLAASVEDLDGSFNVGTGVETSVNSLTQQLAGALGITARVGHGPAKAGEQTRSVLDPSLLLRRATLAPPTNLADGLALSADWFREHFAG